MVTRNFLSRIDKSLLGFLRKIGQMADARGLRVYIVGGIVRDIVLRRKNLDVDIVLESGAIAFAQDVAKGLNAQITVYREFGTATIAVPLGLRLDFVTARKEHYARSGVLPEVSAGTLHDDLFRRDFTINAMAICLNEKHWGQLVDEFGGLQDLRDGKVRVLHNRSFIDDPTRILRAVRFEQRLGFRIEPQTVKFLKRALREKVFDNVHPSRYFTEFKKMLLEDKPELHLKRLKALGALPVIDSALPNDFRLLTQIRVRLKGLPKSFKYQRWLVYLMAITETIKGEKLTAFLHKFPFRTEERESIEQACGSADILRKLVAPKLSRSQVYRVLKPLHADVPIYLRLRASQRVIIKRIELYLRRDVDVKADINGEDLKRLGCQPGKKMGEVLAKVLDMKIDGRAVNRASQITAAKALLEHRGEDPNGQN